MDLPLHSVSCVILGAMRVLIRNTQRLFARSGVLEALLVPFVLVPIVWGLSLAGCATSPSEVVRPETGGPSSELIAQIDAADVLSEGERFAEARQRYEAIFVAADSRGYHPEAAEAAAQAAVTLCELDDMEEARLWLERAEANSDQSHVRSWSRVLLARGMVRWKGGEDLAARRTFIELYNFCFLHSLTPRAIQAATLASRSSLGQEQLDWSMRAIQAAQTTGNLEWQAPLWTRHAWFLDHRKRHEEALEAFKKARDLTTRVDISRLGRLQTEWAYAHGLRMAGQLEKARDTLEQTNAIAHSIYIGKPSPAAAEYLGRVLWELGEVDATEGRVERARERFVAARQKLLEAGPTEEAPLLARRVEARIEELDQDEEDERKRRR